MSMSWHNRRVSARAGLAKAHALKSITRKYLEQNVSPVRGEDDGGMLPCSFKVCFVGFCSWNLVRTFNGIFTRFQASSNYFLDNAKCSTWFGVADQVARRGQGEGILGLCN
jgi:hypothetical protein